ncbi:MAG: hypothetical protein IT425_08265 [Pirellulales bacterium]|nr:hypothetical protein [Pirellulales bacterium]
MKYVPLGVLCVLFVGASALTGQVIYNSASTAAEGYANGVANVLQASGQRNLSNSQARINNQDAYSKAIDNSTKSVNAFWEQKDIYHERVQQKLAETDRRREAYMSRHGLGNLSSEEFDRTTGAINWLKVLEQSQYDTYRKTLDELFRQRAYNGALTGDQYMQAAAASKGWRDMLSKQKEVYPAPVLSQMIRFILKLNRELDDNLS